MNFSELNLEESVLQALDAMNFKECTPVQEHTIPVLLEGKDLIGDFLVIVLVVVITALDVGFIYLLA